MENAAYSTSKISVWWDIENCEVPRICDANSIALNITTALINSNFHGPVSISAYGDTTRIPFHIQHALSSTGVSLHHVPAGVKEASDKMILVDMLLWAIDNPAPANYLLISGDRDFSSALHRLRMRRYNILLAQPFCASAAPLTAAATIVWSWPIFIAGGPPHFIEDNNKDNNVVSNNNDNNIKVSKQNPNFSRKLIYKPKKPSITSIENVQTKESDNNNTDSAIITNVEHAKIPKLFRLAPHEFFGSNGDHTTIPVTTFSSNLQSHHQDSTKKITCSNFSDSYCGYDAPTLSANHVGNAPIVVRETREDSKPISNSLPASPLKVHNNLCGGGQEFCNENLNQKNPSSGGGSEELLIRRVRSLPIVLPCEDVKELVDVILVTLNTLKDEMVFPTEGNITDCVHYGDPKYQTIDVRKALNCAIEQQKVVKRHFGALHLYVLTNENLWKCVNPLGGFPSHYPEAIWVRIKQFLASSSGRSSISASHCRYEASLILKRLCLGELVLGDVLKILEIIITINKWIIHRHPGWQPITISLTETTDDN